MAPDTAPSGGQDHITTTAAQLAEGLRRLAQVGVTTACFTGRHDTCSRRPGCGCACHRTPSTPEAESD